jgi:hypothetical protein
MTKAPDPVGRGTRRAEDVINQLNCLAPVVSRAVGVIISNGISEPFHCHNGSGDILNAQSCHAHGAAQNRRVATIEQSSPRRAEFLAPPGQVASPIRPVALSPFRRFAPSPFRPVTVSPIRRFAHSVRTQG